MKISLIIHHFPPKYYAGTEMYTLRLVRWLKSHGHAVEVVCVEAVDQGRPGELRARADTYDGIAVQRLFLNLISVDKNWRWSSETPLLGDWFKTYFERTEPDLIHFQAGYLIGITPLHVAASAGIPTALTLHDYWYLCPRITLERGDGSLCRTIPADPASCAWCLDLERRRYRLPDQMTRGLVGRAMRRLALRAARDEIAERRARLLPTLAMPGAVIVPSRFLADLVAPFVKPERLYLVPHGLDLTLFQAGRRPAPDGVLRVAFIGQVAPHKGVHVLVEAFRMLPAGARPAELHIYGGLDTNPDYVQRLRRLAGDDPRIHLHGPCDNRRVAEVLGGSDVTVVPSVWHEIGPLVMLESFAAGTPVIASPLGNMADMIHHRKNGLFFAPGDVHDLARQLQRLMEEPDLLPALRAGIAPVRSESQQMDELEKIYQNLMAGSRKD